MATQRSTILTLSRAIHLFVFLSALIGAAFSLGALRGAVSNMIQRASAEAVTARSAGLLDVLRRELADEWQRLAVLAERIDGMDPRELRTALDLLAAQDGKLAWLGFAGIDGTVLVASNGLLEGQNVAQRNWFLRGLEGPHAGDVDTESALAQPLETGSDEPPGFLNYALPVVTADGRTLGVLSAQINFEWTASLVAESARALEIDAVVVSGDGTVIVSTLDENPAHPTLGAFRLASLGATGAIVEPWPDRRNHISVVRPVVAPGDAPNFGWRLIARVEETSFMTIGSGLASQLLPFILGMISVLALATFVFVQLFVAPFALVARNAKAIADGEDVFPFESRRTGDLAELSAAVALLQRHRRQTVSADPTRTRAGETGPRSMPQGGW